MFILLVNLSGELTATLAMPDCALPGIYTQANAFGSGFRHLHDARVVRNFRTLNQVLPHK